MKSGGTRGRFAIGAVVASTWTLVHAQADAPPQALPPVEVIGVTPLLGGGIDRDYVRRVLVTVIYPLVTAPTGRSAGPPPDA